MASSLTTTEDANGVHVDLPDAQPISKKEKLGGYEFYRSIGSPRYVVAPMVDQSELAWRMLSRSPLPPDMAGPSTTVTPVQGGPRYVRHTGGAHLCYTPMIHAKIFATGKTESKQSDGQFDISHKEEGSDDVLAGIEGGDRPLFVQFCANDPDMLLAAAKKVEKHCDAVDINFGCPQGIAKRGNYGAFLQDDWDLIQRLVGILHTNLAIPVTAKFRLHPDPVRTIAYARMLEAAGAQILTVHGRTREMKGQQTGLADWEMIKKVKEAVNVPVFANGNILYGEDVEKCLEMTGCDGVMSAEGNLSNPSLFLPPNHPHSHPSLILLANRYLDIVAGLRTPTGNSAMKSHLFRLLKPVLDAQPDESMRIKIAQCAGLEGLRGVVREIEELLKPEMAAAGPSWRPPPLDKITGYRDLPIWVAQPYIRPLPRTSEGENSAEGSVAPVDSKHSLPVISQCVDPSCTHAAATKCPEGACLTHCRSILAIRSGMEKEQAEKEAAEGGLVGKGCEAHEEKVRARGERLAVKRKNMKMGRSERKEKMRKAEAGEKKSKGNDGNGKGEKGGWNSALHGEVMDEEMFVAGISS